MTAKAHAGEYGTPVQNCDTALFSLVAGVLSYVVFFFVGAVASVILGHVALGQIHRSGGRLGGRWMALTGLILGYIQVVGLLLLVLLLVVFFLLGVFVVSGSEVQVSDDRVRVTGPGGTRIEVSEKDEEVRVSAPGTEIEVSEDRVRILGPGGTAIDLDEKDLARKRVRRGGRTLTKARTDIGKIEEALIAYWLDMGAFPPEGEGLARLIEKPEGEGSGPWKGPYLDGLPRDPWGREYVYRRSGAEEGKFDVFSLGRDGIESEDDVR